MKRILLVSTLALMLAACSGEDLKKQIEQKNQLLAAQQNEIKKLQDDLAAREADLKNQCEQRIQKLTAQNKHQVDTLTAKVAELSKKKKEPDASPKDSTKKKSKSGR